MKKEEQVKKYIDELISGGAEEIKITWEGGNDEGSFYLYVDDEEVEIDWNKKDGAYNLIDYIADKIDYGSFAGDFSTYGEITYDAESNQFIGCDQYEEIQDYTYKLKNPLVLTIPKDLWFDTVDVDASGYSDDLDVSVRLSVTNGPVIQDHVDFESKSVKDIIKVLNTILDTIDDVRDIWYNGNIVTRENLGLDENGNYKVVLTEFMYNKYETMDKEVTIQL